MRGRDAGARCGGARNGPPGLQKRAVQESLRTAEKSRAGRPPDRKRGRLTEAPAADRRGTHKDAQRQAAAARKKALSALPSDSVTRKSLTTERPERYVVPVFRVTFGLHSVVIQPRGQRPTSAMPRPSTPPAAPSTPLFSFPHPSTPFNAGPFGPAALHPTGRIAFRPPAPQSRKQTSTPVFPARPHRIAPDPLHCIPPSCVAKPQTNLNHGSPVRPRRIAFARSHRPHRRTSTPPFRAAGARRLSPPCHPSTPPPLLPLPLPSPLRAASSLPRRGIFLPAAGEAPRFSVGGAVFRALIPTFAAQVRSVAAGSAGGGKSGQRRAPRKPIT